MPRPWWPYIIGTNLLTKIHDDRKINLTSRVLTRKNAPPPGSLIFQQTETIFQLVPDIIYTNLLTKFHEDQTIKLASRVLTRFYYSHKRKNAPPLGDNVFSPTETNFELVQEFIGINLLTKFHEDRTINVASTKIALHHGAHVFSPTGTILKLVKDKIGTNILTKFHDDWKLNVASKVLTMKNDLPPDIIGKKILTKFHEDRTINVASEV
ncbi:hypothetical protein DPMN_176493 [Dreissena polymorpha]|uniref:Uncharacterized protein n=1 Tax=Dreissena polymorpha TaxID=45954 RepID=A0A9D4E8D7_DREPO|nr:hypothetical protein DPMN_176493 [Dreissena polymorpha]